MSQADNWLKSPWVTSRCEVHGQRGPILFSVERSWEESAGGGRTAWSPWSNGGGGGSGGNSLCRSTGGGGGNAAPVSRPPAVSGTRGTAAVCAPCRGADSVLGSTGTGAVMTGPGAGPSPDFPKKYPPAIPPRITTTTPPIIQASLLCRLTDAAGWASGGGEKAGPTRRPQPLQNCAPAPRG